MNTRRWSIITELEADTETITHIRQLLVDTIEQHLGVRPRTKTIETAALEVALKPAPPLGKPPSQTTTLPRLANRAARDKRR
ncbi:MAG TPA: hypothetical protein VN085_11360 [Vicinamibacterales bacterium]|nr:hypothetical protein [Vicinamibacterales bacterium]